MYSELLEKLPARIQVYFMHTEPNLRWSVTLFSDMKNRCSKLFNNYHQLTQGGWQYIYPKKYPLCRKLLFIITLNSPRSYNTVSSNHWLSICCEEQRPPVKDVLSWHPVATVIFSEVKVLKKILTAKGAPRYSCNIKLTCKGPIETPLFKVWELSGTEPVDGRNENSYIVISPGSYFQESFHELKLKLGF